MRSVPGWGVLTSTAAPVLLIGGWTLAARLQPGHFDEIGDTISALAADDAAHRWVMTSALVGVGIAHVGTALALRPASPAGRLLLATGGVATVAVAAYPLPGNGGPAQEHALAAGVAFLSLAAWPVISWRRRTSVAPQNVAGPGVSSPAANRDPGSASSENPGTSATPIPFRPGIALVAGGALLAGLGWFFAELLRDGDRIGLSERAAAGSQALWPLAAVLLARREQHR